MTVAQLKTRTVRELVAMAKRKGVSGWHGMKKQELIQALLKQAKALASPAKRNGANGHTPLAAKKNGKVALNGKAGHANGKVLLANGKAAPTNGKSSTNGHTPAPKRSARVEKRLHEIKAKAAQSKDLSHCTQDAHQEIRDRLVVMVRDSHWLHAYWELGRASVERARAALGQHWYGAKPVLRLLKVSRDGTTSSVRKLVRDIEIHGGVNNWYVDVDTPPQSFQLEIGYLALDGRFVSLAKSNTVTTPVAGVVKGFEKNWVGTAEDFDRIYALSGGYKEDEEHSELKELFEEQLQRPMGQASPAARFGMGAGRIDRAHQRGFCFQVDAELVVFGVTEPDAQITLRGEPVRIGPDGTFSMRFNLPDRRQVLPVVASSHDGVEQRTIVLAVERNTKIMEPVIRDPEN